MAEYRLFKILINGRYVEVADGTTVAAAMVSAGLPSRHSVSGEARAPYCGMGVCMECRAIVDQVAHERVCQMQCRAGMEVECR